MKCSCVFACGLLQSIRKQSNNSCEKSNKSQNDLASNTAYFAERKTNRVHHATQIEIHINAQPSFIGSTHSCSHSLQRHTFTGDWNFKWAKFTLPDYHGATPCLVTIAEPIWTLNEWNKKTWNRFIYSHVRMVCSGNYRVICVVSVPMWIVITSHHNFHILGTYMHRFNGFKQINQIAFVPTVQNAAVPRGNENDGIWMERWWSVI